MRFYFILSHKRACNICEPKFFRENVSLAIWPLFSLYFIYIFFNFYINIEKKVGKWPKNPQTPENTAFFVDTFDFKSGQNGQKSGQNGHFFQKLPKIF
jgi:hypothetical protein